MHERVFCDIEGCALQLAALSLRPLCSPGLDILACTSKVVEDVCCRDSVVIEPSTSALNLEVTAEDRRKIHVLSWLYFEERQCIEAVMQTNRLMREFLSMLSTVCVCVCVCVCVHVCVCSLC